MLWAALRTPPAPDTPPPTDVQRHLANWALQFTPRVALLEEAVVMEVAASVRLFGGKRSLRDRVVAESRELGCTGVAWADNSFAALCLARAGIENGFKRPLPELLDGLRLHVLTATHPHATALSHLGCEVLGDLRRLPRGGLSLRFGDGLVVALDLAYGGRTKGHAWVEPPEQFSARLEFLSRVELAQALLQGASRLLQQLGWWLSARHAGVTAITFEWAHDVMRARHVEATGSLTIRTAEPTRNIEHLEGLLAEHLAHVVLEAPAGEVMLTADEYVLLEETSASFLPDVVNRKQSRALLRERVAARIGPENVQRPVLLEDHRTEWTQHWLPMDKEPPKRKAASPSFPAPTCVLDTPVPLAVRNRRPYFQGPLKLLLGPHLAEGGWWHRTGEGAEQKHLHVRRDYYVAMSTHAGVLWIFQEGQEKWFLHGSFS
ncbi:Y-family DNA polymerase [Roseateles sp. P5_E8]